MNRNPVLAMPGLSRRAALGRLAAVGAALGLTARPGRAAAQEATPAATAAHPIVGLWTHVSGPGTPPGLRAFTAIHGDGTLSSVHSFGGAGAGAWHATGERSVRWVVKYLNIADAPGQFVEGTVTVFGSLTVDEAGATVTEESTVDVRAADDTVVANFPFTTTFARVPVEAPPATGTPAAGTPAP